MKRIVAIAALLAVVGTSCSSGLSDAQTVWCNSGRSNRSSVIDAGSALGLGFPNSQGEVDMSYSYFTNYPPGDPILRNHSVRVEYSFSQADFDRACKAAYESR